MQRFQKLFRGFRNHGAGREDRLAAGLHQRLVILRRHDAADHDHDVVAPLRGQLLLQFRHQSQMRGGERRDAEDVHVVFHRLAGGFLGRREQRPDVDVEAEIGESRGDHLLAAVVAVLADFGDEQTRGAALRLGEFRDETVHPRGRLRRTKLAAAHLTLVPQLKAELAKQGRDDIMIVVGGVVPSQDYDALQKAGAEAIFPPGTVIAEAAEKLLKTLRHRLGHDQRAAE
jgi:methylmalonyl-CoA mutase cobalamin-binding domain/chain